MGHYASEVKSDLHPRGGYGSSTPLSSPAPIKVNIKVSIPALARHEEESRDFDLEVELSGATITLGTESGTKVSFSKHDFDAALKALQQYAVPQPTVTYRNAVKDPSEAQCP